MDTKQWILAQGGGECWQKRIANGGEYVEKQHFVVKKLLYQTVLLCSLYLLSFPWKQIGGNTFRVT